ncbi:(E)-4-hydroxy-3-methylbut-2-enyl-diphosphate synthase [Algoriphagus halophytocola]|uniref:4-hydroxy-3-methylbut-2-en-1-yl diphosphate synthase (flavodoxin) n=1 Tax=Algoriphagus halophytocola TaxID=2991499 RepID=A0ABY6MJ95_9BACT|nr:MULTISPECIES: (E)-4-hydroxy-3-methylbut-2-enyl-diphosphate synthase [unclassified Algoriphagus]UZD22361.1 (E)-4-hydroxy-3-methylbut-2-enyl-diphosphate synthase [Algoriphagus sp. TR-M5]WBL43620.1 (E)-4-hydroxy-3-methylbut-2-enyl-diphosphate synthase [Algoriphagus sp. TR-M9]
MEPIIKSLDQLYCDSLTSYSRRKTIPVKIGDVVIGGDNPIVVQSMTTVDTMDTEGSIEQSIRMIEAGCELVRITAPSIKEAENLRHIKDGLRKRGYTTPLVADIHFTPNAAEVAARIVEKVRVNPGNYADKKKFEVIEYTDATYQEELDRIRERFLPLVKICKENGTAMRIGTNHGSLSDRIMSRYGDTPLGMVESALEFLRICEDENYFDIVISMKSSNTQVMVQAYRLLVAKLNEGGFKPYPLHLGVTEAGEAEDGRIKSAVGIGTLLEDGLGDTVRVSLTEDPEFEAPVAKALIDRYAHRAGHTEIKPIENYPVNPYEHFKRESEEIYNFGGQNVPRVITDISKIDKITEKEMKSVGHFYLPELDKWKMNDQGCDFVYSGANPIPFMLPNGMKEIQDAAIWTVGGDQTNKFPLFDLVSFSTAEKFHSALNFLEIYDTQIGEALALTSARKDTVLIIKTENKHAMPALRRAMISVLEAGSAIPVIVKVSYPDQSEDKTMLYAASDVGGLLIDGLGDGIFISLEKEQEHSREEVLAQIKLHNSVGFGVLQAARTRMSKTEYISCPSCGRTLFDLQETTAMIRKRTDHLKGVKIGIMGCIVNGPGEMADADYGYVGSGKGKITLYKGKEVMKRSVPSEKAVDKLIEIIKEDGMWNEPDSI